MNTQMSQKTRQEVLAQILRPKAPVARAPFVRGRPKEYSSDQLLPPLKAIWLAALQPCGVRLKACLPEWLADYEADHRRLDPDLRQSLLAASRATRDRLRRPARSEHRRRATTRPGSLWHGEILLRTEWPEATPGFLELDTVALCGCGSATSGTITPRCDRGSTRCAGGRWTTCSTPACPR